MDQISLEYPFIHSYWFLTHPFLKVVAWQSPLYLSNPERHASTLGNYLSCVLSFDGMHNGHLYSNLVGLGLEKE